MSKLGTITLTGVSGKEYEFNIYPFGTEFNAVGAVYYISKRTEKSGSGWEHSRIYIGQTANMSERFDSHHKADCFNEHQVNCHSIYQENNQEERLFIENDLVEAYKPPCND